MVWVRAETKKVLSPQAGRDLWSHAQEVWRFRCWGAFPAQSILSWTKEARGQSLCLPVPTLCFTVSTKTRMIMAEGPVSRASSEEGNLLGHIGCHFQFSEYSLNVGKQTDHSAAQSAIYCRPLFYISPSFSPSSCLSPLDSMQGCGFALFCVTDKA